MRTHTELDALVRELAPVRDSELTGSVRSQDAQRLLTTILALSQRRARRCPYVAAAAAAAVVAAGIGLVVGGSHGTATASAATALKKAAAAARKQAPLVAQSGQFVYTRTQYTALSTLQAQLNERNIRAQRALLRGKRNAALTYGALIPWSRESWIGPTGGRMRQIPGRPTFVTDRDRDLWIADGRPSFTGPTAAEWTPLPPAQPLSLRSEPDGLYAQLNQETASYGDRQYAEMFVLVGDALRETNASPAQRAALYAVAARIPGVDLVGEVTDSAGRRGIAVAKDDDVNHMRSILVFDPQTSVLLAEEESTLDGNSLGYPAGVHVDSATYLETAIVDSLGARP
jgi:hypothetical protein